MPALPPRIPQQRDRLEHNHYRECHSGGRRRRDHCGRHRDGSPDRHHHRPDGTTFGSPRGHRCPLRVARLRRAQSCPARRRRDEFRRRRFGRRSLRGRPCARVRTASRSKASTITARTSPDIILTSPTKRCRSSVRCRITSPLSSAMAAAANSTRCCAAEPISSMARLLNISKTATWMPWIRRSPEPESSTNPRFDSNTFGGSVGGPIAKDKLFFLRFIPVQSHWRGDHSLPG